MELLELRNKKIGGVGRGCSLCEMLNDQYGRRAQVGEGEDAAGGVGWAIWSTHRLFVAQNQETHRMSALRTMDGHGEGDWKPHCPEAPGFHGRF